jgi:hypothetical protein
MQRPSGFTVTALFAMPVTSLERIMIIIDFVTLWAASASFSILLPSSQHWALGPGGPDRNRLEGYIIDIRGTQSPKVIIHCS